MSQNLSSAAVVIGALRTKTPGFLLRNLALLHLTATNQRVVAARQQRGLVALMIRGSVLFYSSAI